MVTEHKRIYWIETDRFDVKPNKSPWLEMANELKTYGYNVSLLTGYKYEKYTPNKINISMIYLSAPDIGWVYRYILLFKILMWVLRNVSNKDIIILNHNGLLISPILWCFGKRNIHLDFRTVPVEINTFKKHIDRIIFWKFPLIFFRKFAKGYSFITENLKNMVEHEFNTKFQNYVIWQSGVNTKRFHPIELTRKKQDKTDFIIFYHGSISKNRGIDIVIDAISKLAIEIKNKLKFVIVGDGPSLDSLKIIAKEYQLLDIVVFKGLMPYENIPMQIAESDCCICPLPNRPEWNVSSPLKVFEYMACGKPIILTNIPAHKDIVSSCPYIVWVNNYIVDDFINAIVYSYKNKDMLAKAANSAPSHVKDKYDWSCQAKKLANYLSSVF